MQSKTTRAFRTISEAGEELGLQPHVLRFWESKFSDIKPIKRGGGRRFYRPEDIEFLRGIKILLHNEKHPIKDVQKLIRVKGPGRVVELGRSVEKAATPKDVKDTVLIPKRIQDAPPPKKPISIRPAPDEREYTDSEPEDAGSDSLESEDLAAAMPQSGSLKIDPLAYKKPRVNFNLGGYNPLKFSPKDDDLQLIDIEVEDDDAEGDAPHEETPIDVAGLEDALTRLETLRTRWKSFKQED